MKQLMLVAATRSSREDFWSHSLLGQSLRRFPERLRPELAFRFDNQGERTEGLGQIYNRALDLCPPGHHLLFVHDDVYLHDPFLTHRVNEGLDRFDVLGLAGSRGSDPSQPSWGLAFDGELRCQGWQNGNGRAGFALCGAVSHTSTAGRRALGAQEPPEFALSDYGPMRAGCDLLDGLFLAVDPVRVRHAQVRFDEQFRFHLYDLDFCRAARRAGLSLATWPIAVTHGSSGAFASDEWKSAARQYLQKWGRPPLSVAS